MSDDPELSNHAVQFRLCTDGIVWREVDDQVIVLEMESGTYLNLNGSGCVLWKALSKSASVDQLTCSLVESFDVSQDQARRDTEAFLDELTRRSLVESVG